jgi:site-specific recombinase XerD
MSHDLTRYGDAAPPTVTPQRERASRMAAEILKQSSFSRYQQGRAQETLRRQRVDIALFVTFLTDLEYRPDPTRQSGGLCGALLALHLTLYWLQVAAMMNNAESWEGIEHGLVEMYKEWQLLKGYAIASVNGRVSTIRKYCVLAADAGIIPQEELERIRGRVKTIDRKQALNIDKKRDVNRVGIKKEHAVTLTTEQVECLFAACPDTPQGARDALLLTLIFRYGFRCVEVADLTLSNYKRSTGVITFFRTKTADYTTLQLEPEDRARVERYYTLCMPDSEAINPTHCVIMGSNNRGEVFGTMGERSITGRVNTLGRRILGIENLSGHDGRHYGATAYVAGGTDMFTLMNIFNWTTTQTAQKYVDIPKVANQNAKRGKVE